VAFSMKICCKFTVESASKISQHLIKLQARKLIVSRALLGNVLLKDEELVRDFEYDKKQLSLLLHRFLLGLLSSDWRRPVLPCQLTP